ncbi:MAG: hypothetical protein DCC50_15265, partial [Acidobacteria bacterium]
MHQPRTDQDDPPRDRRGDQDGHGEEQPLQRGHLAGGDGHHEQDESKKQAEGIYAVVQMTAEPATAQELDRQLGLNESVLRTQLLR